MKYILMLIILLCPILGMTNCLSDIVVHLLEDNPNHILYRDENARNAFVEDIINGTARYKEDPVLAIYMAYRESGFRTRAKGDLRNGVYRSLGILQFGYVVRKQCRKIRLDLKIRLHQIICYSYWMSRLQNKKECGSLVGALRAYVSKGGSCGGTPKGRRIVRSRLREVRKLRKRFCTQD